MTLGVLRPRGGRSPTWRPGIHACRRRAFGGMAGGDAPTALRPRLGRPVGAGGAALVTPSTRRRWLRGPSRQHHAPAA